MPSAYDLSVEPFRRVSIRGLLNEGDFDLEFRNANVSMGFDEGSDFDSLRLVYGLNGSGKTSTLTIIRALLVGDIPTLLTIPFHSVEIERWEPWGTERGFIEPVPGGIDGMSLWSNEVHDGTFEGTYNYLNFITKEMVEDWPDTYYKTHLSREKQKEIEDFLSKNSIIREEVERMSQEDAFEFPMGDAHSHVLRIERRHEGGRDFFAAEYKQDRCPYESGNRKGWGDGLSKLLMALGVEEDTIVALEGSETLATGEMGLHTPSEVGDFFDYLLQEGLIGPDSERGPPLDFLGMMEPSNIRELNEAGMLDVMGIWKVWRAFNGDRRHWREDAGIAKFESALLESHGETLGIDWTEWRASEQRVVTLIGPNEKVNSKEFVSSEVDRLQGLLQENRQEADILFGLHTEEEMLTNLERLIKGGMGEETDKFWTSLSIAPFIASNLHRGAESSLSHLVTLPAAVDRIQEDSEIDGARPSRIRKWPWDGPPPGDNEMFFVEGRSTRAIENRHYPFFRDYNRDFLINKSLKIADDLGILVVTDSGSVIPYSKLSHGELRLLYMLSTISYRPKSGIRWPTVLVDEPEVGLHIDWQRKLVSSIKGFYGINNESEEGVHWGHPVKVVIATHSPEIVASSPEDAVSIEPMPEDFR